MRIPELILEEIHLGMKNAGDYYDMYGAEELDSALRFLEQSDEEILAAYPPARMRLSVEKKRSEAKSPEKKPFFRPSAVLRFSAACAAAVAVAFAAPFVLRQKSVAAAVSERGVRVKGNPLPSKSVQSLNLYLKDGNAVKELKNGFRAAAGDVIQLTYNPGGNDYGVIFSVDGNGSVTRHFPEDSWTAAELSHSGGETLLDFSYELDDAPEFEYFVFAASKNEFTLDGIEEQMTEKQTDASFIRGKSYLPSGIDSVLFLLVKK